MKYQNTIHCRDCVDRHLCDKLEIVDEISDLHNHEVQRSELQAIKRERLRLKEIHSITRMTEESTQYDELLIGLNTFAEIFDACSVECEAIIAVAISRMADQGITVKWNKDKKRFERV